MRSGDLANSSGRRSQLHGARDDDVCAYRWRTIAAGPHGFQRRSRSTTSIARCVTAVSGHIQSQGMIHQEMVYAAAAEAGAEARRRHVPELAEELDRPQHSVAGDDRRSAAAGQSRDARRRLDSPRVSPQQHARKEPNRRLRVASLIRWVFPLSPGLGNTTHQCGTLVFDKDPRTSVLDPWCRAHDVENLFVVDASFFPSSAAVNPGLTIVAQALRVADHIREKELK